jgi:hypothetical protein
MPKQKIEHKKLQFGSVKGFRKRENQKILTKNA